MTTRAQRLHEQIMRDLAAARDPFLEGSRLDPRDPTGAPLAEVAFYRARAEAAAREKHREEQKDEHADRG